MKWGWLHKALITKAYDGNRIIVSSGSKSILIILDQEKTKATLTFRGKKLYKFIVRRITTNNGSENMLTVYTDEFFYLLIKDFHRYP